MSVRKQVAPMDMTHIVTTDLVGITRGRSVPTKALDEVFGQGLQLGAGKWVP